MEKVDIELLKLNLKELSKEHNLKLDGLSPFTLLKLVNMFLKRNREVSGDN